MEGRFYLCVIGGSPALRPFISSKLKRQGPVN
jgi:hypothetical protein